MKSTNRTHFLALFSQCKQILEDASLAVHDVEVNRTFSNSTTSPLSHTRPAFSTSRETYDNAYFYILFVMLFYSFLAMTLFKCFIGSDEEKKDPYEEFIGTSSSFLSSVEDISKLEYLPLPAFY
uniref:Uncharacterized protein n=1 Tax=Poecilia mexicana TaxID=48701 RepID=A0A3B3YIA8_9TELE